MTLNPMRFKARPGVAPRMSTIPELLRKTEAERAQFKKPVTAAPKMRRRGDATPYRRIKHERVSTFEAWEEEKFKKDIQHVPEWNLIPPPVCRPMDGPELCKYEDMKPYSSIINLTTSKYPKFYHPIFDMLWDGPAYEDLYLKTNFPVVVNGEIFDIIYYKDIGKEPGWKWFEGLNCALKFWVRKLRSVDSFFEYMQYRYDKSEKEQFVVIIIDIVTWKSRFTLGHRLQYVPNNYPALLSFHRTMCGHFEDMYPCNTLYP